MSREQRFCFPIIYSMVKCIVHKDTLSLQDHQLPIPSLLYLYIYIVNIEIFPKIFDVVRKSHLVFTQKKNGTKRVPFGYYSGKRYPFCKVALFFPSAPHNQVVPKWYPLGHCFTDDEIVPLGYRFGTVFFLSVGTFQIDRKCIKL